jgi:hypothetical protein
MRETLETLRFHWSDVYQIAKRRSGQYVAEAKFGQRETLTAEDPGELLRKIRQHYPGPSERSST